MAYRLIKKRKRKPSFHCFCWTRDALFGLWFTFPQMIEFSSFGPIVHWDVRHFIPFCHVSHGGVFYHNNNHLREIHKSPKSHLCNLVFRNFCSAGSRLFFFVFEIRQHKHILNKLYCFAKSCATCWLSKLQERPSFECHDLELKLASNYCFLFCYITIESSLSS